MRFFFCSQTIPSQTQGKKKLHLEGGCRREKRDQLEECWQKIHILWKEKEAENYSEEGKRGRHRTNSGGPKT